MIENLNEFMSTNMAAAKRSAIREILKLTQRPEVISFAGGLPAPASFPVKDIKQCIDEVLDESGPKALQYGTTEGDVDLRNEIVKHYARQGMNVTIDNLMITTASQQALDIAVGFSSIRATLSSAVCRHILVLSVHSAHTVLFL